MEYGLMIALAAIIIQEFEIRAIRKDIESIKAQRLMDIAYGRNQTPNKTEEGA